DLELAATQRRRAGISVGAGQCCCAGSGLGETDDVSTIVDDRRIDGKGTAAILLEAQHAAARRTGQRTAGDGLVIVADRRGDDDRAIHAERLAAVDRNRRSRRLSVAQAAKLNTAVHDVVEASSMTV